MNLSPGRFQMILSLSEVLSAEGPQTKEALVQLMQFWAPSANVGLLEDGVQIGESIGLFNEAETEVSLSKSWSIKPATLASNVDFARSVLREVVKVHFPELIAFSFLPIRKVRNEIDGNIRAILDDCRLLEVDLDTEAIDWWGHLRSLGQFTEDDSKKKIGTDAELLTVAHEIAFLTKRGVPMASENVIRVAENNDRAGFDVLSMNLDRDIAFGPQAGLQIEVKVGRKEEGRKFSLMFTRHEHRVMTSGAMPWVMQVWLYKTGMNRFEDEPITISREAVQGLIPVMPEEFEWETARLSFERP